jgi:hypothetical protein
MSGAMPPLLQYAFMAWCLVKAQEQLYLTLNISEKTYEGVFKSFRTESIRKYTLTTINTHWEAIQRVMAAKLTRLTHKIAIQLRLVAESCTIYSFCSRRRLISATRCSVNTNAVTERHGRSWVSCSAQSLARSLMFSAFFSSLHAVKCLYSTLK